ncbi:MAG: hypothetical protein JW803_03760 [Endomicrobiales bacterium]|nr:hypothetical protein [Endomicrobiales bacterium]
MISGFASSPLFVKFGAVTIVLTIATAISGSMRAKMRVHIGLAILAVFFGLLHMAGALGLY